MYNLKNNINVFKIPFIPVYKSGFDPKQKLSEHLTLGELYDATKVIDKKELLNDGLPMHENFLEVFELLRSETKKPLFLGSAFRSYDWERLQNRSGSSQHCNGLAYDFNGANLKKVLTEALETKNGLYHKLRQLGVNGFGAYDWGFHLDFRPAKLGNDIYFWDERKKKVLTEDNKIIIIPALVFLALFFRKTIFKLIKI